MDMSVEEKKEIMRDLRVQIDEVVEKFKSKLRPQEVTGVLIFNAVAIAYSSAPSFKSANEYIQFVTNESVALFREAMSE